MIPTIDNKEVLPVRFIEYYTGGKLGPEGTALLFAHRQGIDWNRRMTEEDKLTAYHRQGGKITPLKRKEWQSIVSSIKSLSERYDNANRHFSEWLTAALQILPVAFVWRNEFDAAYYRAMSPKRITFVDESRGFERLTGDEDKAERETIDTPCIPPELYEIVFKGFNDLPVESQKVEATPYPQIQNDYLLHQPRSNNNQPEMEIEIPLLEIGIITEPVSGILTPIFDENKDDATVPPQSPPVLGLLGLQTFDAEKHIERRLAEAWTHDEITVELVEKYGTKREKHYGLIARKLYNHTPSISKATWRKRGQRDYEEAKNRLTTKNATLSHPPVIP